ncbi:hypothetical protein [Microbacterium luticocti]|uniref:hypothetical protein n=1 Tax=Microbacterium luticocti TaxID=451764 RepID=UPI0004909A73|nr:hypothetical protein [Microbacterium luticocti]
MTGPSMSAFGRRAAAVALAAFVTAGLAWPVQAAHAVHAAAASEPARAAGAASGSGSAQTTAMVAGLGQGTAASGSAQAAGPVASRTGAGAVASGTGAGPVASGTGAGAWAPPDVPELDAIPAAGSRPQASKTIFIDVDGGELTGTFWNAATKTEKIVYSAGQLRSDEMLDVYRTLVQTYSPFDVNITFTDPGRDKLVKDSPADQEYGVTVLITQDFNGDTSMLDLMVPDALGLAPIGGFGAEHFSYVLVSARHIRDGAGFNAPDGLIPWPDGVGYAVGSTTAHEIAHTLGLQHHGYDDREYFASVEGVWGPIMGSADLVGQLRWTAGYPHDTRDQDDLAMLTEQLSPDRMRMTVFYDRGGMPLVFTSTDQYCTVGDRTFLSVVGSECGARPEDVLSPRVFYQGRLDYRPSVESHAIASPRLLPDAGGTIADGTFGEFVRNDEADYYRVDAAAGPATISVAPYGEHHVLDLKLTVLDREGKVIAGPVDPPITQGKGDLLIPWEPGLQYSGVPFPGLVTGAAARVDFDAPEGGFIVKVEQGSYGDMADNSVDGSPASPTYGALGWFTITGEYQAVGAAPGPITPTPTPSTTPTPAPSTGPSPGPSTKPSPGHTLTPPHPRPPTPRPNDGVSVEPALSGPAGSPGSAFDGSAPGDGSPQVPAGGAVPGDTASPAPSTAASPAPGMTASPGGAASDADGRAAADSDEATAADTGGNVLVAVGIAVGAAVLAGLVVVIVALRRRTTP